MASRDNVRATLHLYNVEITSKVNVTYGYWKPPPPSLDQL